MLIRLKYKKMKSDKKTKAEESRRVCEAYEFQKKDAQWTFYSEREMTERLLSGRFNFLILFVSLFINAIVASDNSCYKLLFILFGFVISVLIGITMFRTYFKLEKLLKILRHDLNDRHVLHMQRLSLAGCGCLLKSSKWFSTLLIQGVYIPVLVSMLFLAMLVVYIFM